MPIKKSAQKALRQTKRRTVKNQAVKLAVKKAIKELRKKLATKDKKGAQELMPKAAKVLDKAAKVNVIKRNAATRYKSRLQKAVNQIL